MAGPLWREIAETLREQIESGELSPGEQLPTEIELMERFDAGRNTIRQAIQLLTTRNLVVAHAGRGTFVTQRSDPFVTTLTENPRTGFGGGEGASYMSEVTAKQRKPSASIPRVEVQAAEEYIARHLDIPVGTMVVSRHQQRYIDERPWSLQTSYYPMTFVQEGAMLLLQAEDLVQGAVAYLEQVLGIRQVGYQDLLLARPPHNTEADFFKLPDTGSMIFEQRRTAFDEQGARVRLTVTVYPTDRSRFLINEGIVPEAAMSPMPEEED